MTVKLLRAYAGLSAGDAYNGTADDELALVNGGSATWDVRGAALGGGPGDSGGVVTATGAGIASAAAAGTLTRGFYVDENGTMYLATGPSTYVPLAFLVGTGQEPTIAAVKEMKVLFDAGSDIDHAEIYYTLNCYAGDPDTPDTALASARFNDPTAEVFDLSMSGGSSGAIVIHAPLSGYLTTVHFAFAGSGTYTVAAGNTVTALQMVVATFSSALLIRSVVVYFGESAVSGGSNQRIRKASVVGFQ